MATPPIDRDKLRVFVRQLDNADLLVLLDRAIDLLPKTKLPKLIKGYARPADLRPDHRSTSSSSPTSTAPGRWACTGDCDARLVSLPRGQRRTR